MGGVGCGVCGTTRSRGFGVEITTVSVFLSIEFPELDRVAVSEAEACAKINSFEACARLATKTKPQALANLIICI